MTLDYWFDKLLLKDKIKIEYNKLKWEFHKNYNTRDSRILYKNDDSFYSWNPEKLFFF